MSIEDTYNIHSYSSEKLVELFTEHKKSNKDVICRKAHLVLLKEYFIKLKAKTIIQEYNYIDKDYLEDYSSYYVRCFEEYDSRCTRLHFFNKVITSDEYNNFLKSPTKVFEKKLIKSYLGFIVVKPLPETVIGRTCLKTYNESNGRRYPIKSKYEVNLFGLSLELTNTLAFQEQDTVTAACASSALWSTFQGTGKQFQHKIPSPVEVTKAAHSRFPMEERELPTHGLFIWQMAHAISSIGLEPIAIKIKDDLSGDIFCFKSNIYAYLRAGIPVPLILEQYKDSDNKKIMLGEHAIAITGYHLDENSIESYGINGFKLKANRIDKIYVHDDCVGPFARMKHSPDLLDPDYENIWEMTRVDSEGEQNTNYAKPKFLLIPAYHKIRIPFRTILSAIFGFDKFLRLREVRKALNRINDFNLEWDIYLTDVKTFKKDILSRELNSDYRLSILTKPMPKYLWRASAEENNKIVIDIIFDATDIEQGSIVAEVVEYDQNLGHILRESTKYIESKLESEYSYLLLKILKYFSELPRDCQSGSYESKANEEDQDYS